MTFPLLSRTRLWAADHPDVEPTVFPTNGLTQSNFPAVVNLRMKALLDGPEETYFLGPSGSKSTVPPNEPHTSTFPDASTAIPPAPIFEPTKLVTIDLVQTGAPFCLNLSMSTAPDDPKA